MNVKKESNELESGVHEENECQKAKPYSKKWRSSQLIKAKVPPHKNPKTQPPKSNPYPKKH